jgi:hypothetical protein
MAANLESERLQSFKRADLDVEPSLLAACCGEGRELHRVPAQVVGRFRLLAFGIDLSIRRTGRLCGRCCRWSGTHSLPPLARGHFQAGDRAKEDVPDGCLIGCRRVRPHHVDQCSGLLPGDVGVAVRRAHRWSWHRHRWGEVGDVHRHARVVVRGEFVVRRQLIATVTGGLGLELDEPYPVRPQDCLIWCAATLIVPTSWEVEFVDEDRPVRAVGKWRAP